MATTIVANLQLNTTAAQRQLAQFNQKISRGLGQPLGRITGDAAEFQKSLSAAAARVSAFGAVTGVLVGVSRAISGAAQATVQINKDLVELNTFLGQSTTEVNKFGREIFQVARRTASDFKTVAEAAKEFARQGLSTEETLKRTNSALILSRISGLGFAEAVTSITTAINTFNKSAIDSEQIVNKLIAVDTRFAVSSNQIAQALSRVGSSAEESGLSLDQLIATVTAVQQITGRGGSVIGNSLKTIFTRIRRPEVIEQLQSIGVTVKDQNGALLDGITVLQNYANATKNLSQVEKSRTAELLGGVFQINQLQAIIRDLTSANSVYASSLKISENASDDAIKKNNQLNQSYSALFARTRANLTELGGAVGENLFGPLLAGGANAINELANKIKGNTELSDAVGESLGRSVGIIGSDLGKKIITGIGKTLGTAGPALAGLIGTALVLKIGKFAGSSLAGLGRSISQSAATAFIGKKRIAEEQQIQNIISSNKSIIDQINSGTINIFQAENLVRREIAKQNQELANQLALVNQIASKGIPRIATVSNIPGQSVRTMATVVSPKIPGRSGGYIPAFAKEEAQARGMGAINPKAGIINANIGGKSGPVIVNNQEKIFNVGGQTAIVPNYRSLDKIPNFASGAGLFRLLGTKLRGRKLLGGQTSELDSLSGFFQQLLSAATFLPFALSASGASPVLQESIGGGLAGAAGLSTALRLPRGTSLGRRALGGLGTAVGVGAPFAFTSLAQRLGGRGIEKAQNIQAEEDRIADEFNKSTNKLQDLTETLTKLDNAFKDASATPDQLTALSKKVNQLTKTIALEGDASLAARIGAETDPASQLKLIQDAQNQAIRKRGLQESILGFESLKTQDADSVGSFFNELIAQIDKSDPNSIKVVTDFFDKQSKETQSVLVPAFLRASKADRELNKLKEKTYNDLSAASRAVNRRVADLRISAEIRTAREKAFESGIGSAEQIASSFSESAGIDFKTRAASFGSQKQAKREFFSSVSASGLTGGLADTLRAVGPSEQAGNILKNALVGASEPQKKALNTLISKNESLLSELEKSNKIAEQDADIQRKILNIRERISFGGGIESSLSGSERAKSINAPLRGALQFRLGGMMGSRRSQIAGLTNFLSAIEEQVPGATERSPGLRNVRERLTGLRQVDLRSDLLRNARIAGGLGLGDVGSSLSILANNPFALRNIASTQAGKALPGGQAPDAAVQFLNQSLNDYVSGLSQKLSEDRSLKTLEAEKENTLKPILDKFQSKFSEITETVKDGLKNVSNITISSPGRVEFTEGGAPNRSKGFIPAFANPLRAAISRESQFVPSSTIRVNQSSKLVNSMNPMGLAVTNTIDEPNGLASIGLASSGFIPNFGTRTFDSNQQAKALGQAAKKMLYAFDASTGKYYRIGADGVFSKRPISPSKIPASSQIISFSDTKQLNRLRQGLSFSGRFPFETDRGLNRLGSTLRSMPSASFERYMTGNSGSAKAFNLAEKFQPFGQGPRQPSDLVRKAMNIGKSSRLALPPFYPDAIRLPESMTSRGELFRRPPAAQAAPGRMTGIRPSSPATARPSFNTAQLNKLRGAFKAFGEPELREIITAQKELDAERKFSQNLYNAFQKHLSNPKPNRLSRFFSNAKGFTAAGIDATKNVGSFLKGLGIPPSLNKGVFQNFRTGISVLGGGPLSKTGVAGASLIAPIMAGYEFYEAGKRGDFNIGSYTKADAVRLGLSFLDPTGASLATEVGRTFYKAGTSIGLAAQQTSLGEKFYDGLFSLATLLPFVDEVDNTDAEAIDIKIKAFESGQLGRAKRAKRKITRSRKVSPVSLIRRDPVDAFRRDYKNRLLDLNYSSKQADVIVSSILDRYALSRRYMNFSSGYIPNFAGGAVAEMMDIASSPDYSGFRNAVPQMSNYYPNVIKNSAEIEVPATEVYNRMGFFGAKPKNPAQQYAILNPAQQAALGYASEGFVPNFAMEQFASAIGDAFQKAFSPYADKMGSSSNTSNVINVSDQRSYQANTDKIEGIMEFLYKQFPKEMGKFGAVLKK